MSDSIRIRAERPQDGDAIHAVNTSAFGQQNEAVLVDALRGSPAWVEGLSLVAEAGDALVGHILFSRCVIKSAAGAIASLALATLPVQPGWQRRGVGSALVRAGLAAAAAQGFGHVIVLGHPEYYPRFGFTPASRFGIHPPFDVPDEAFMALALQPGALDGVRGMVRYPPAFDSV